MNRLSSSIGLTLCLTLALLAAPAVEAQPSLESIGFHVFGTGGSGGPFGVTNLCPNAVSPFLHWDLREFPSCEVPYEVNGNIPAPGNPGAAAAIAAVDLAAGSWTGVSPAYITLFNNNAGAPNACPQAPGFDARNCVAWDPAFPFGGGVLGVTYVWRNAATGILTESDITMNPVPAGSTWQGSPPACGPFPVGIQAVMTHEFGHLLGLAHPNQFGCANDDPGGATIMAAFYTDACKTALHQADQDGANYLYTADLGDHPDPPYPTKVHSGVPSGRILSSLALETPDNGPEHLFGIFLDSNSANFPRYQYEWLAFQDGAIDDHPQECEARPLDAFDDGVSINGTCLSNGTLASPLRVSISVKTSPDVRGRSHTYNAANPMYLNGFFDWNGDGDFVDLNEHAIGTIGGGVKVYATGVYPFSVPVPPGTRCNVRSRFRLDWREDVGQVMTAIEPSLVLDRGAAQHGEVEDHLNLFPVVPWNTYCHVLDPIKVFFPQVGIRLRLRRVWHLPIPRWPRPIQTVFPPGGEECMESTVVADLDYNEDEKIDEVIGLTGPVCVRRSDPYVNPDTGLNAIDIEMTSLEVTGFSELAGQLTIRLAPGFPSLGEINQTLEAAETGVDISEETPADSFFEVYFEVDSETLGVSEPAGPARVEAEIASVPPGEPSEVKVPPDAEQ